MARILLEDDGNHAKQEIKGTKIEIVLLLAISLNDLVEKGLFTKEDIKLICEILTITAQEMEEREKNI